MRRKEKNKQAIQSPEQSLMYLELWAKLLTTHDQIGEKEMSEIQERMEQIREASLSEERSEIIFDQFGNEVNMKTGEALPAIIPEQEEITIQIDHEDYLYIRQLHALDIPPEDKAALLSIYDSPVCAKSFKTFINKEVDIYGAIIWTHPPYKGKDGVMSGGYEQVRMLTMEGDTPTIIVGAIGALGTHIDALLRLRGWYIWDSPVKYRFGQDEKTNAFRLENTERVRSILLGMKTKKK